MRVAMVVVFVVLIAAGWAAMGGLIASLWEDGFNLLVKRHRNPVSERTGH